MGMSDLSRTPPDPDDHGIKLYVSPSVARHTISGVLVFLLFAFLIWIKK